VTESESTERIQLSMAQVAASCAAAVSAAVLCSFFGVAGTVIGTAATSLVATIGSAIYSYSLRRTKSRLRQLHQAGAASPPVREVVKTAREQGRAMWRMMPTRVIAFGAIAVFIVSIGVVTAIELGIGKSLSAAFGVSHGGGHGNSLGSVFDPGGGHHKASPTPSNSPSSSPSPSSTPSNSSPSPAPTVTRTVSQSPSSTPTPTPHSSSPGLPTVLPTSSKSR
jgi:hypothetical protein